MQVRSWNKNPSSWRFSICHGGDALRWAINGDLGDMGLAQVLNELSADPHKILHTTELWVCRQSEPGGHTLPA